MLEVVINGVRYVPQPPPCDNPTLLDFEFNFYDHGRMRIRDWLCKILTKLMRQGWEFSSYQPFGSSDWIGDLPHALVEAGVLENRGQAPDVYDYDDEKAKAIIAGLISEMCSPQKQEVKQ